MSSLEKYIDLEEVPYDELCESVQVVKLLSDMVVAMSKSFEPMAGLVILAEVNEILGERGHTLIAEINRRRDDAQRLLEGVEG